ncbi:MAG: hypothetical protein M3O15_07155 [Acidobacteriota bacterium]|nr:hypothetical protein [Acidobacteriota bacterium]
MNEKQGSKPEEKPLDNFEVTELDDKDLEDVAGGDVTNNNCGCTVNESCGTLEPTLTPA